MNMKKGGWEARAFPVRDEEKRALHRDDRKRGSTEEGWSDEEQAADRHPGKPGRKYF
jgi:hypothetical protein